MTGLNYVVELMDEAIYKILIVDDEASFRTSLKGSP